MRIEHIALWTNDLEGMKEFYVNYFQGTSNQKYCNLAKGFESYFISFATGARLEIMRMPTVIPSLNSIDKQHLGLIHLAFSVGSKEKVDELTEQLRNGGYRVISEPRYTGDGYYESCILDPDDNRVEITI